MIDEKKLHILVDFLGPHCQFLQLWHLAHGGAYRLHVIKQHQQQYEQANQAHDAVHLFYCHHQNALVVGVQATVERVGNLVAKAVTIHTR